MYRLAGWCLPLLLSIPAATGAQVIEFESRGLKYQTLSRNGVTIMYARLPNQVREYSIIQAAVTNGSKVVCTIHPEDFSFRSQDGREVRATPADTVVSMLLARGSRGDVIKLVTTYEISLYGLAQFKSTSGYEQRRRAALAELTSTKITAAATASAIAFVEVELKPGESTDGALFFPTRGRPLAGGRLRTMAAGQLFEFEPEVDTHQP
jgi:hypothetical protein